MLTQSSLNLWTYNLSRNASSVLPASLVYFPPENSDLEGPQIFPEHLRLCQIPLLRLTARFAQWSAQQSYGQSYYEINTPHPLLLVWNGPNKCTTCKWVNEEVRSFCSPYFLNLPEGMCNKCKSHGTTYSFCKINPQVTIINFQNMMTCSPIRECKIRTH